MFEARMVNGGLLKAVIDAFKDMVNEGVWDCSKKGIAMQVSVFLVEWRRLEY